MADYQAGKRYAQAAFAIAKEHGTVPAWRADLRDIAAVLTASDAAPVLINGRISLEKRLTMVERMLDIQPLALNLARLLVSKGRSLEAQAVSEAFDRMADADEGIELAEITTAVTLSAQEVSDIETRLGASLGKIVKATSKVDPLLLGGVVIKVGDKLIDGSLRTRLKQLRRELVAAR